MQLRPYQEQAVSSVFNHLRARRDNPVFVIATGGGKTPCLAEICRQTVQNWSGRALVLSHVKELIQQSAEKMRMFLPPEMGSFSSLLVKLGVEKGSSPWLSTG